MCPRVVGIFCIDLLLCVCPLFNKTFFCTGRRTNSGLKTLSHRLDRTAGVTDRNGENALIFDPQLIVHFIQLVQWGHVATTKHIPGCAASHAVYGSTVLVWEFVPVLQKWILFILYVVLVHNCFF